MQFRYSLKKKLNITSGLALARIPAKLENCTVISFPLPSNSDVLRLEINHA